MTWDKLYGTIMRLNQVNGMTTNRGMCNVDGTNCETDGIHPFAGSFITSLRY